MCIQVKDHSRVMCEQLQQLRLQTGLVDLDIVCEDHHINVHKVVMAACSRFFKDQLCKQDIQGPVILRLEDFGLEDSCPKDTDPEVSWDDLTIGTLVRRALAGRTLTS